MFKILFNLSSSSNISESLTKFGSAETDTEVLIVSVDDNLAIISDQVTGYFDDVNNLSNYSDEATLTKLHKLKSCELSDIVGSLCTRISAKDAL